MLVTLFNQTNNKLIKYPMVVDLEVICFWISKACRVVSKKSLRDHILHSSGWKTSHFLLLEIPIPMITPLNKSPTVRSVNVFCGIAALLIRQASKNFWLLNTSFFTLITMGFPGFLATYDLYLGWEWTHGKKRFCLPPNGRRTRQVAASPEPLTAIELGFMDFQPVKISSKYGVCVCACMYVYR